MLLGELGEVGAGVELGLDLLGLLLGLDEDVAGVHLVLGLGLDVALLVELLDPLLEVELLELGAQVGVGEDGALLVPERDRHVGPLVDARLARRLGEQVLVDHLLEDAVEQHLVRQRLVLVGQLAADDDQLAEGELGAVDLGERRVEAVVRRGRPPALLFRALLGGARLARFPFRLGERRRAEKGKAEGGRSKHM